MGIRKFIVLAHEWEPYYKDEFRRAARLARELCIAIEPLFDDELTKRSTSTEFKLDEFDPQDNDKHDDE